ncbi:MAG: LPXTG cell wall anchor domain-containing protein [Ruminococcus sp.]|nr:LPXTG cell wall anchor domain-containing protein [Ruminococcus sp.]
MKVKFNQFKTKSTRNSDSKGSNIMKKNRKLTALLVAACMTIPMAATTFTVPMVASGATVTIQADSNAIGYTYYYGYKVFEGYSNAGKFGITNWGSNINVVSLIEALKADSTFGAGENNQFYNIESVKTPETAMAVANIINGVGNDSEKANAFARLVGANVDSSETYENADIKGAGNGNADVTMKIGESSDIPQGYYVIIERYAPETIDGVNQARTLGLLRVVGSDNLTISTKRSAPTIAKSVENDGSWGKVADACIGDAVAFKIIGTLPVTIDDYGAYYYLITDTLGTEFDAPAAENVTVKVGNNTINQTNDKNCRVTVLNNKITVSFEDVTTYDGVTKDTIIEVTYSAKLNSSANIGETGQTNKVQLTYLSNPNSTYSPDLTNNISEAPTNDSTGETDIKDTKTTVDDNVKILTYQLDIEKVDAQNSATKLANAKFKLKNDEGKYALVTTDKISGWGDETSAYEFVSNGSGIINIIGLDEGTYYLKETAAPDGYNVLPEEIKVVITANTQDNTSDPINNATENLTVQVNEGTAVEGLEANDNYTGVLQIQVANNKGTTLPETGGIGTKIFYILGGTLVIGSGAALVIKKRMGKDEE